MAKRSDNPPTELEIAPTALQEAVLGLLEDAGIDTATNDQIMKLIEEAELTLSIDSEIDLQMGEQDV